MKKDEGSFTVGMKSQYRAGQELSGPSWLPSLVCPGATLALASASASASARVGPETAAPAPGQSGRLPLCTSPFSEELQVPSEAVPVTLGTGLRGPTKQTGSPKLRKRTAIEP